MYLNVHEIKIGLKVKYLFLKEKGLKGKITLYKKQNNKYEKTFFVLFK